MVTFANWANLVEVQLPYRQLCWCAEAKIGVKDAVTTLESVKMPPVKGTSSSAQSTSQGRPSPRVGVTALDVLQVGAALIVALTQPGCQKLDFTLALIQHSGTKMAIPTRLRELDAILGGGIPCGEVTEICEHLRVHLCCFRFLRALTNNINGR